MNKEEKKELKECLKKQDKQDNEETKEDLRILYKILKDKHKKGTLTIERGLKYISKLELEVASYKIIHEYDVKMIDNVKGEAVKLYREIDRLNAISDKDDNYWKGYIQKQKEAEEICKMCKYRKRYKELKQKESILDKVTEECRKKMTEYEDSILEIFPQKLLYIIEGEKK